MSSIDGDYREDAESDVELTFRDRLVTVLEVLAERVPLFEAGVVDHVELTAAVRYGEKRDEVRVYSFEGSRERDEVSEDQEELGPATYFEVSEIVREQISELPDYALEEIRRSELAAQSGGPGGIIELVGVLGKPAPVTVDAQSSGDSEAQTIEFERNISVRLNIDDNIITRSEHHTFIVGSRVVAVCEMYRCMVCFDDELPVGDLAERIEELMSDPEFAEIYAKFVSATENLEVDRAAELTSKFEETVSEFEMELSDRFIAELVKMLRASGLTNLDQL